MVRKEQGEVQWRGMCIIAIWYVKRGECSRQIFFLYSIYVYSCYKYYCEISDQKSNKNYLNDMFHKDS